MEIDETGYINSSSFHPVAYLLRTTSGATSSGHNNAPQSDFYSDPYTYTPLPE